MGTNWFDTVLAGGYCCSWLAGPVLSDTQPAVRPAGTAADLLSAEGGGRAVDEAWCAVMKDPTTIVPSSRDFE